MTRFGLVCGLGLALTACTAGAPVGSVTAAIVGGTTDTTDTSVVMWYAQAPGANVASICTAEVISPHVVVTAAHCVSPDSVTPGSSFSIVELTDYNQAGNANFLPVDETHFDPAFVNTIPALQNQGHDIAVGIFDQPIGLQPLSYNHTPLGKSYVGKAVRIVGYGVTKGGDPPDTSTAGVRRQGTAKITKVDDVGIQVVGKTNDDCEGDSGGPTFLHVAGKEVIAAVTSIGDTDCTLSQGAMGTNLASYSAFLDQYVDAADPPTAQGAIGATCTTNRDCASQICGSDGKTDYCMQACSGDDGCPMGYYCGEIDDAGFCIAGVKPASSGCDVSGSGTSSPWIFVGFLLLVSLRQTLRKTRSGGRPYC